MTSKSVMAIWTRQKRMGPSEKSLGLFFLGVMRGSIRGGLLGRLLGGPWTDGRDDYIRFSGEENKRETMKSQIVRCGRQSQDVKSLRSQPTLSFLFA